MAGLKRGRKRNEMKNWSKRADEGVDENVRKLREARSTVRNVDTAPLTSTSTRLCLTIEAIDLYCNIFIFIWIEMPSSYFQDTKFS